MSAASLVSDLRNATPITTPQGRSWSYVSGSGTIADPWIYGEAYSSTGVLVYPIDMNRTIKWPKSGYNGTGSGWADNDTTSYPEVSNSGTTINITRFNNAYFSFTDPYDGLMPSDYSSGGPGTLSISSGSLVYDQSNSKIVWTINASSPSTSSDVYAIVWSVSGGSTNNYGPLNFPTDTTADITSLDPLTGTWQLTHINTSTGTTRFLDQLTIGSNLELVTQKKCFCNFW